MTSNIGAHKFHKRVTVGFGSDGEDVRQAVVAELKKAYAPEFINRLDEIVVFDKLSDRDMHNICVNMLRSLKRNIKDNCNKTLLFDKEVVTYLLKRHEGDEYGARPLKRLITEHVETPLAEHVITNPAQRRIRISVQDNLLHFLEAQRN